MAAGSAWPAAAAAGSGSSWQLAGGTGAPLTQSPGRNWPATATALVLKSTVRKKAAVDLSLPLPMTSGFWTAPRVSAHAWP